MTENTTEPRETAPENSLAQALQGRKLILASASPRRREFFRLLGVPFETRTCPVEENYPDDTHDPEPIVEYLSRIKARAVPLDSPADIVVSADTIVWADNRALGKPHDRFQAEEMLRSLSARTHRVLTGVTLRDSRGEDTFHCSTLVRFAPISAQDIRYYVALFSPMDKAGAYGIQEWIGQTHIESIEGSYHNVVGLPTAQLYERLKKFASRE